jgi:hypothetical protein
LPVRALVVLERREGLATRLDPLSRAAAVAALAPQTFGWHVAAKRELERLASFVTTTECYRLRYSDLTAACEALGQID